MKIHRLQFNNINNLKGEHTISFDELPLSSAGIFAIVGPTGSGKSTILDVITLALFNRIPRFKKSISTNEITKEGSVVTHHTSEASAAIDYEIKGLKYRSTWSVSTNRNGKLKAYEMFLYDPDGIPADLKKSEVPGQNEKIIGLNYDQFIKSILLSQGEFSKFLKADKNDRGKLLENITGTSIYRSIGMKAFERHKLVKENLTLEQASIGGITSLEKEVRLRIITELQESKKEKVGLEATIKESTELIQIKKEIQSIKKILLEKQRDENLINTKIEVFGTGQKKLDLHNKLIHVQGPLATYNDAVTNAVKSQENLKQYKLQLTDARKSHEATIVEMAALTKKNVDEGSFKKVMKDFETEINNADRDLENLLKNGKAERERINKTISNYPIPINFKVKPDEAITQLEERADQLTSIISKAKLTSETSTTEVRKLLKQNQDTLESLKEILRNNEKSNQIKLKLAELHKELEKLNVYQKNNTPLIEKCQKLLLASEQKIELLIKQKEDAIKIAELESHRNALSADTPCPLCGSLQHPYAAHKPELHQTEIELKVKSAREEHQNHQTELESRNNAMIKCGTSISHHKDMIVESTKQLSTIEAESTLIRSNLKASTNIDHNDIALSIETLTVNNDITETAIDAISELKLNKDLRQQFHLLKEHGSVYKTAKLERDAKYDGPNVNIVTNKLQDSFESSKSRITALTSVIKTETDSLIRDTGIVKSIAKGLNPKVTELGFSSISEISTHILDETTLNHLTKQRETLRKAQTSIETEIKTLILDLNKKIAKDIKPGQLLDPMIESLQKHQELLDKHRNLIITNQGLISRDNEDRKKIKAREKSINKLSQELEKWALLNKMIGDANGNKFANFAQGLTLQNLLVYANRRLQNLSDRYLLDKPENDGALIIIDKYQGNTRRSVTTLSGGESFLISLALALSLSDMASKNVALECLFIDEGFGTLDPESLESALGTLEKLQSESQKTVGVISHVEALKERIDVQIKLHKNAHGYSQIEISEHN